MLSEDKYLYRALDSTCQTIDFLLTANAIPPQPNAFSAGADVAGYRDREHDPEGPRGQSYRYINVRCEGYFRLPRPTFRVADDLIKTPTEASTGPELRGCDTAIPESRLCLSTG